MLISEKLFTSIQLKVGQIYKIKLKTKLFKTEVVVIRNAKLIQQTKYFFVFEYKSKSNDKVRVTISKFDYYNNRGLIQGA